jgi:hypothetical protein
VKKMIHPDRIFSFKELDREEDLIEAMTNHKWPICYGFYYGNLLYLGDGDSEDHPEYAVITVDSTEGHHGVHGREVGRIKPLGMPATEVQRFVADMIAGRYQSDIPVYVRAEPMWHHSCSFCQMQDE